MRVQKSQDAARLSGIKQRDLRNDETFNGFGKEDKRQSPPPLSDDEL